MKGPSVKWWLCHNAQVIGDQMDRVLQRLEDIENRIDDHLPKIARAVTELEQNVTLTQKEQMEQEARMKEWQLVASVADRLFFILFLIFSVSFTTYVFMSRSSAHGSAV